MKRFHLITEVDARTLEPGTTVELLPGGHVTPLARDTLRARRITVLPDGGPDRDTLEGLAPKAPARLVAVGSDHAGFALKQRLIPYLRGLGLTVHDHGVHSADPADYPDIAASVATAVARGEVEAGIVIDGAGLGSAIAANKIPGIRAAMCADLTMARYAREHNGANVLTLGASIVPADEACRIAEVWLTIGTSEPRYLRRLAKIRRLEERRRP